MQYVTVYIPLSRLQTCNKSHTVPSGVIYTVCNNYTGNSPCACMFHKTLGIYYYINWRFKCATFATGSTVHHKLNSTSKPSLSLLSAPPHVLPPMPSLCLPFLKSLLPHRQGYKGHLEKDVAESEVGAQFRGRRSARNGCG